MRKIEKCESPIERDFLEAFEQAAKVFDFGVEIIPQFSMGKYRYDFGIIKDNQILILIECDGKDYHSSSQQMQNDMNKTQKAIDNGVVLLRFHGTDIYNRPNRCIDDTVSTIEKLLGDRL